MERTHRRSTLARPLAGWLLATALLATALPARQGPPPEERAAVDAVLGFLRTQGDAPVERFVAERLSDDYRARLGAGAVAHLAAVRDAARGTLGDVGVDVDDQGLRLSLSAERSVVLRLVLEPGSGRIERLDVHAQGDGEEEPEAAVRAHVRALEALGSGSVDAFVEGNVAPRLRASLGDEELNARLQKVQRAAAAAGMVTVERSEGGYTLSLRGGGFDADVSFEVEPQAPFRIAELRVDTDVASPARPEIPPLTWDTLAARMRDAAARGLAGTLLAIRDGKTVLSESYGLADRSAGRPNDAGTIYGMGSMPIDFTRAAIYLLLQRGALALEDPITRFFPQVPADKRSMTVEHLLSGASGLPNFHHRPEDADRDLTWIDRETAESRILSAPLLFEPGAGTSHSHSAFVLLAALVERVSGHSYRDFVRTQLLAPAGLEATGFYGEDLGLPRERFAVGYGGDAVGDPNIPPNWGETSWLVMGSGGMFSNPADLARWFAAMRSGRILQGRPLELYLSRRSGIGASDRGFTFLHAWNGGDSMIFLALNAGGQNPGGEGLVRALIDLVASESSR